MSEERGDKPPEDRDVVAVEPEPNAAGETPPASATKPPTRARPAATFRQTALWLAALLVLVIAGLALSPFWAPAVAPLLPWAAKPAPMAGGYPELAARVAELEGRPAPPATGFDAVKSTLAAQAQRVDRLEAALAADGRDRAAAAADKTALQQLTQRVAAIEARSEAQAAGRTAGAEKTELGRLGTAVTALGTRLSVLEQRVRANESSSRNGAALLLAVLQMRDAVAGGQPFPTAYAAFDGLARDDPALMAGAAPLAEAARDGVASRSILRRQQADHTDAMARADKPAVKLKWWEQALDRIKRLVTIRRIGSAAHNDPEAAITAAQSALASSDLAGAVSALGSLSGSNANAAQPWLRMARGRLAAEAALAHLQELLAAHLGAASTPPPAAPGANPAPAPAASRARS